MSLVTLIKKAFNLGGLLTVLEGIFVTPVMLIVYCQMLQTASLSAIDESSNIWCAG